MVRVVAFRSSQAFFNSLRHDKPVGRLAHLVGKVVGQLKLGQSRSRRQFLKLQRKTQMVFNVSGDVKNAAVQWLPGLWQGEFVDLEKQSLDLVHGTKIGMGTMFVGMANNLIEDLHE